MMVGVPVLFWVCECACAPFTCVMVVGVWCLGWCVFQYCVAVVCASRRVPGVVVGFGVWVACSGVVWLVLVGVCWLVCVVWFRMLTCLASFFLLVLSFVLSCCLVNNGSLVVWARVGVCLWACFGVGWWLVVFVLVCGRVGVFCGRVKVCLSASCGLLGCCCLCVGLA